MKYFYNLLSANCKSHETTLYCCIVKRTGLDFMQEGPFRQNTKRQQDIHWKPETEVMATKYSKRITLKNGLECQIRNGTESDGQAVFDNFNLTHGQTDYMLTYPDENHSDWVQEGQFLKEKSESENEVELVAVVDHTIVGTAGIEALGTKYKIRHRAGFGISISREYWGLGIGQALLAACIECARTAGYIQFELNVVSENVRAISLYEKAGFVEYGRNPKGFRSRLTGFQEVVYLRLEL